MNSVPLRKLLFALPLALACQSAAGKPMVQTAEQNAEKPAPAATSGDDAQRLSQRGKVQLVSKSGGELQLDVEIAANDHDRMKGLMFRREMPEMAGMIFVFPEQSVQSFWMKNTILPLDMLFIDAEGMVVGIVENAEPQTLSPRSVGKPSKYVLEVNGGWCARHGVRAGDKATLEGMYRLE